MEGAGVWGGGGGDPAPLVWSLCQGPAGEQADHWGLWTLARVARLLGTQWPLRMPDGARKQDLTQQRQHGVRGRDGEHRVQACLCCTSIVGHTSTQASFCSFKGVLAWPCQLAQACPEGPGRLCPGAPPLGGGGNLRRERQEVIEDPLYPSTFPASPQSIVWDRLAHEGQEQQRMKGQSLR